MTKPELIGWTITTNENGVEMATLPAEQVRQAVAYIEDLETKVKNLSSNTSVLSSLPLGCKVKKIKGYKFDGTIVANFKTVAGKDRLVVDNGDGMLHIFNEEQLERVIA